MRDEKEQDALTKIKAYLDAGHSLDAIRAAGWGSWIDRLQAKGYDLSTGHLELRPPQETPGLNPRPASDEEMQETPVAGSPLTVDTTPLKEEIAEAQGARTGSGTADREQANDSQRPAAVDGKRSWYQRSWAVIIWLVLIFPLGLFMMWRFTGWSKGWIKWPITVFFILTVGLIIAAFLVPDEDDGLESVATGSALEQPTERNIAATLESPAIVLPPAPTDCPEIPVVRGNNVDFCTDRQKEIFAFWMDVWRIVSTSDQNEQTLKDAAEVFENGRMLVYDYYSLLTSTGEYHHLAENFMWELNAPDGLEDAQEYFATSLKNRGDGVGHLAKYLNTGDLEELRKGEQDIREADSGFFRAMSEVAVASEQAGLPFSWLADSVECESETRTCVVAQQ